MATELTAAQLRAYDGTDPSKPIYVSVRGKVYDVTSGRGFYGPGGAYAVFAGREASRALGKMSKDEADVSGDLSGLTDKELGVLADWEIKFQAKYPVVARLAADA
ncbi:putative steroid-binding protein 3 [Zea mays]|jgi:membrane-associated progesterone receptor component|uniref:Membrane steroid-binding protein 1 n=3 Tax=Zea mays TaxID=4577 RepID=B4FPD1_MAIZE|nr:membrane steroid-binding protein 1 [Zea mays]ACF83974.1 unknown [Zea mays]ACG24706.1 membrane steroid-binding protein 1 [Zea mays]ACG24827.1 membrane steroid-binding protein 1 [Zea mays]ACG24868.1 membrane steroid-binding protein 1 [Zea mays]AQK75722.1 putative steroid-binding protein 3 [Zea mays]|eukprot:NP_001146971.1 membrane steroid-binding protein 1 [Zea mays]